MQGPSNTIGPAKLTTKESLRVSTEGGR